jgi:hypothetical protein
MTVEMDGAGMEAGDTAGLALLSSPYAWIGVAKTTEGSSLQMLDATGSVGGRRGAPPAPLAPPSLGPTNPPARLWLRVACNFDTDEAVFSWSPDGRQFAPLGKPFTMTFQLRTLQWVGPALFHFNTAGRSGGFVDFDNYVVEEPRARGPQRMIPTGRTITLTSGADGSYLAAETRSQRLVNIAAVPAGSIPAGAKLQVLNLGLGRVALKTADGHYVSAAGESAILKDLAGTKPGVAESFQWINLLRGDTMLMSLTNHRYLATRPNEPGPVTVTATGPQPARKGGAEVRWAAVE